MVSVAGGAVLDPDNRTAIRQGGLTVWLRADVATLASRVGSGSAGPCWRAPAEALARLAAERAPVYTELAELVFDVDRMSPSQVVGEILRS